MELIKEMLMSSLLTLVVALVVTLVFGPVFIPWLRKLKFGQEIREEGPKWHQKKSGTPTMGGIMFIVAMAIAILVTTVIFAMNGNFNTTYARCIVLFVISLGFGVIGFVDDYIKVVKKRNLGLTAPQKFIMQVVLAAIYIAVLYFIGELDTAIKIPFTSIEWTMPIWLYIPFVMFVVVGVVNAVNLTDGLDGLASSITTIVGIFFMLVSYIVFKEYGVTVFSAALIGGLIGFLWYNKYPISKAGTYQVPIKSLTSAAPIPAVQTAFAKALGDSLEVTVNEDGKMQAIATLQNMIINLGKEYYANVLTIANGTTLSTKVEKSTQGMNGQTVDVDVPEKILFDLPQLDENNSTVLSITVDFMNAMMGQGNDYPTNVTLTLDLDNVQQLQKEYVLEDGTYNVPVDVLKENSDGQSMAAKAIESAQINVNNNEVTVTLKLKEMTIYGQTASVDKMEYQLKDGTYQEATIIEEENGHPTKVQFKLDQNVKLTNVKFYYGGSNRGATARLSLDLDHLTKVIPSRFNQDGTYSVDVALWNATSDKASMAAAALDSKAKIIVKDGKATMYISTKEMSFGTIKASLQEFYIGSAQEDYKNHSATIIEKDTQGNPTLWSFELPHEDEYINVMMNPHVAMMGNMDLEARIKVDYSTLTYISDKTELETNTKKEDPKESNQNQASNTATENKTETTKDNQQESQAVKTGDQAPITMMSVLGMISLFMFVVLQKKYEA